jgi:hypothetical protein
MWELGESLSVSTEVGNALNKVNEKQLDYPGFYVNIRAIKN